MTTLWADERRGITANGHPVQTPPPAAPARTARRVRHPVDSPEFVIECAINDWVANGDCDPGVAAVEALHRAGYEIVTAHQAAGMRLADVVSARRVDELIADRERRRVPFVRVATVREALDGVTR